MNDFTKDDLIKLHIALQWVEIATPDKVDKQLMKRIACMIDNYCEHDWRKGVHLFNDIYCTKCKQHFEVNNEA